MREERHVRRGERGYKFQALYARKLIFNFKDDSGALGYLKGREVALPDEAVWFYDDFFKRPVQDASAKPQPSRTSSRPMQNARPSQNAKHAQGRPGQGRSGSAGKGRAPSGARNKGGRR